MVDFNVTPGAWVYHGCEGKEVAIEVPPEIHDEGSAGTLDLVKAPAWHQTFSKR
jgi:hypothetical protein